MNTTLIQERLQSRGASNPSLGYRPDIDGMRGVAVLLVVLYHLRTAKCVGGFIGVDVFFVISGYLISARAIADVGAGRFSIAQFYERRIRRIVPALFVMLTAVVIAGSLLLLPYEIKSVAEPILATVCSASNFYFLSHTWYFGAQNGLTPLLHTWSLAVEEQFYLVLPGLLLLLMRLMTKARVMLVLCALAVTSLLVSTVGAAEHDSRAFFLLHSRAWELLLGVFISQLAPSLKTSSRLRNLVVVFGLLLILIPAFTYSDDTRFPGLAAIPPCLGAAMIIVAGTQHSTTHPLASRLLGASPARTIGLISYSLYLWHWPLIVFSRANANVPVDKLWCKLCLLSLSVAIAYLSWRFIEKPCRYGGLAVSQKDVFRLALICGCLLAGVSLWLVERPFIPLVWKKQATKVAAFGAYDPKQAFREGVCFLDSSLKRGVQSLNSRECLAENPSKKNILLLGDSHAAALWYGLSSQFPDSNILQATAAGCPPLLARKDPKEGEREKTCDSLKERVFGEFLSDHRPDALFLAARWSFNDLVNLKETIQRLGKSGVKVVVLGPTPEYDVALPRLLALSIQREDPYLAARHIDISRLWLLDSQMRNIVESKGSARFISLLSLACSRNSCAPYASAGVPLFFDGDHLTKEGSVALASRMRATRAF